MNTKRATEILLSLVQGTDPSTGEAITGCEVLQRADVLRALLAGGDALNAKAARDAHRASLPNKVGHRWTADEDRALVTAFQSGDALTDIASKHGRTLRGIEARLERLGLLTHEQRVTRDAFSSNS
jgi:hypothetical protein